MRLGHEACSRSCRERARLQKNRPESRLGDSSTAEHYVKTVLQQPDRITRHKRRVLRVLSLPATFKSEMGEIDRAAIEEGIGTRRFTYKAYKSTCLVENDDEPPLEMNLEALKIALQIALLLQMQPFEQAHTMRKLVIDGSNTSGFQRTALLAAGGYISLSSGSVRIDTLSVEEEAAQIVDKDVYSIDRLGIPLVEIGTAPDVTTPKMARELALAIGTILRACKVKRGIGTIRQDINISHRGRCTRRN